MRGRLRARSNVSSDRAVVRPVRKGHAAAFVVLGAVFIVVLLGSLALGRYSISLGQVVTIISDKILGHGVQSTSESVLVTLRLPRVLCAAIVGAALAVAGSAYQGLFRNPMVSPDILGASAGAGFGAALGILFSLGSGGVEALAFGFGIAAVAVTYCLSRLLGKTLNGVLVLVLGGMVIGNLFAAFTSGVKFLADPNSKLPEITFWLMGSLSAVRLRDLWWLAPVFVAGSCGLFMLRWQLNVMSCGEEEALSMGVNVKRVRYLTIVCASLITSSAVAVAGMVGWVGLIVPHLARFVVGSDHRLLIPASMLMGAAFLLLVDDVCRSVYTTEIPLTIVTAVIGAPLFVYLLARQRRT